MPDITLLVETADLRAALTAIHPFTHKDMPTFENLTIHAREHITEVTASNGSAAALAIVSTLALTVDTGSDDTSGLFELSVGDVKKVLQVFQGKTGTEDEPGNELRLDVDSEHLTVTDASGMFEGQQLVLPRQPATEHRPNVVRALGHWVHSEPAGPPGGESVLFGPNLAKFVGACKVYGSDLTFEFHPHGDDRHTTLVRCGESFIGLLSPRWENEDDQARRREHRDAWTRRIDRAALVDLEVTR